MPSSVWDGLTNTDAAIRELTRGREREMDRDGRQIMKDGRMVMEKVKEMECSLAVDKWKKLIAPLIRGKSDGAAGVGC